MKLATSSIRNFRLCRMTQRSMLALFLFASLVGVACSGGESVATNTATDNSPVAATKTKVETATAVPADVVLASAPEVAIRAGGTAKATVRLTIADGFHINANPATHSFLIATKLEVTPGEGITSGAPAYPAPLVKKFAFDETPLAVYEGETAINLPLSADASAKKGARTVRAKIRVQPCNDDSCFPPRTLEALIPVTVN